MPRLFGLGWQLWMPALLVAFAAGFALSSDWLSRVVFGLGSAAVVFVLLVMAWSRRIRGARSHNVSITADGLETAAWTLAWDKFTSVGVGHSVGSRTLDIKPHQISDIRTHSAFVKVNLRLSQVLRQPPIRLPESILDRPIDDAIADMERAAGRSLRSSP